ncbi:CrcB family protein [Herbiconiux sp. 11R-BC]|uniref:fluoride efflux transporter FluC n=1 Tax=Herbiconiux sp. 11R-BC TaxID=3111637 RepID=UPI003C02F449
MTAAAAFLAVALAGGAGAVCRLLLGAGTKALFPGWYPVGTLIINVSGSLLLGFATGLALAHVLPAEWRAVVGTGFLGGYTTFSTASADVVQLARDGHRLAAAFHGLGMFVAAVAAAGTGMWLAS